MVLIRDKHLEGMIDRERIRRGDATMSKTLCNVARERLLQLEADGVYEQPRPEAKPRKGQPRALAG